jgi:hypothetical protein
MYIVTLNELKGVLKVRAQAGQNGAVNKTSLEPTAQDDDFREVKRRRRHFSNHTSQTAKKSTKSIPISTAVKLPPKAVSTRNAFAPLRTTDMDTQITGAGNAFPEQEAPRNSGRPPPIVMTCNTYLNRLQSYFKEQVK